MTPKLIERLKRLANQKEFSDFDEYTGGTDLTFQFDGAYQNGQRDLAREILDELGVEYGN